ncbi:hypothetical protein P879_08151, partial [Paragonimus westermani]
SSGQNVPPVQVSHAERPSSSANRNENQSDDHGKQLTCTADCTNIPDQPETMHEKTLQTVCPIPDVNIVLAPTEPDLRTVSSSFTSVYSKPGNFRDRLHFDYRKLRSCLVNHFDQRTITNSNYTTAMQPYTSPGLTQTLTSNDSRSPSVSAPLILSGRISQPPG